MPWDTAPQPAPVARAVPKRTALPTYWHAAATLGVSASSLWKRLRRKRIGAHVGLPLEAWRTLAVGLARRAP